MLVRRIDCVDIWVFVVILWLNVQIILFPEWHGHRMKIIHHGRNFVKGRGWPKGIVYYEILTKDVKDRKAILKV
jgi:hypothetical protein